jgi:enoyl-CoA hydratase/carnithine racemase
VGWLIIKGAGRDNLIDTRVAQELCAAAEDFSLDENVRVVVLRGAAATFCGGAERDLPGIDWAAAIAALPQPLIAAVSGDAVGEGAELALIADLRVASRTAAFTFPQLLERRLPSSGATQRLPRLVGRSRALEILLSGRRVGAAEAARIGLVTRLTAKSEAGRVSARLANDLAAKGPIALRLAKEAVIKGLDMTLEQGIRLEQDLYVLLQTTADRSEGVRSFLKKRHPRYRGR